MSEIVAVEEKSGLVSLAIDRYNCYPGEKVTFFVQFTAPGNDAVVQFIMPRILKIEAYHLPDDIPGEVTHIIEQPQELIFSVSLKDHCIAGNVYEFSVTVLVDTFPMNQFLMTEVQLLDANAKVLGSEVIQISVYAKGKYLGHLPDIYERDEFVNRFLMLVESFWKPISQQIDQGDSYYDPELTPDEFVPWLASWVGLPIDETLPLERVRKLLKSAIVLYQFRGTCQALTKYLELYTSGEITVIEKRARNFYLHENSKLGVEIALGKENQPNSLVINMRVPESELARMDFSEDMYLRKMREIIRQLVPAHTMFDLNCTFAASDGNEE